MRSLVISLLIVLGLLAYASSWAGKLADLADGRQIAPRTQQPRVTVPTQARQTPSSPISDARPETVTVYKWRDERGVTHFESRSPPAKYAAEALTMPARAAPRPASRPVQSAAKKPAPPRDDGTSRVLQTPWSVYLPGGQEALMKTLSDTLDRIDSNRQTLERLGNEF